MAQVTISEFDEKKRVGKAFSIIASSKTVLAGSTVSFIVSASEKVAELLAVNVESDAESMEWIAYGGSTYDDQTGTVLEPIAFNQNAATKPNAIVTLNPTVSVKGKPFFDAPVPLVALPAAGNKNYINETIIGGPFEMNRNVNYLIEITNTSASDCVATLSMTIINE